MLVRRYLQIHIRVIIGLDKSFADTLDFLTNETVFVYVFELMCRFQFGLDSLTI